MKTYTPSPNQLKEALEHIYYEITQLIGTLITSNSIVLNNALVESRLIHVRALLDFFQKPGRTVMKGNELDDVLCSDYGFITQPLAITAEYQERLNKDLAHLTYSRSQRLPKDKPWPHENVVVPLLERFRQFGEYLISSICRAIIPRR